MPYTSYYGPKKSLIRISLLLLFILVCPMVSMGLDITRSTEPNLAVDPGSSFYLTIPLANPESQITGSYVIISDAELKSSVETALAGSGLQIDWPNKKVAYIVRSKEMLRKSWDEQLGKLFDAVDAANLGLNLITLEPPSPTDIVTIFTGTPIDWTIDLGDNYRGTELEGNSKAIENCMKSERDGFWVTYSGGVARKSIRDGILIPPTTDILIQIPLKAPENRVEHQISLNIPYYYTSSFVKVPQCAALKITSNQVIWKKTVSVKKDKSEGTSSSGPDPADGTKMKYEGNGHYYELVKKDVYWNDAKSYAENQQFTDPETGLIYRGHLATITSPEENSWIVDKLISPLNKDNIYPWIGGFQGEGYSGKPAEGWQWINGEKWSWTNWKDGEPNDLFGRYDEKYLKIYPGGKWNDESIDGEPGWDNYILIEFESTG